MMRHKKGGGDFIPPSNVPSNFRYSKSDSGNRNTSVAMRLTHPM